MAKKGKLKKYQNNKFIKYTKINGLKISDNEAYIYLKVDNLDSIISEYSFSDNYILKQDFLDTIEKCASFIPLEYPLVLEIENNTFTSEEKIRIRKLIRDHFSLQTITKEEELKADHRESRLFLLFGITCFIISWGIYDIEKFSFINEITLFIASFSVWESFSNIVFEEDELKEEIEQYKSLSKIRVIYK